ncbi:hypothetical protein [Erwinia typographi]|uniref:hypothetical protein n=1 Tax=Erwinia typographi TaxID=371042 RepID=UPI0012ECE116|nr:hypothetical protein [Erwinia typographi]
MMKELSVTQLSVVRGAGNFADKSSGGRLDSQYRGGKGGAPKTCANNTGAAMIIGALTGIPFGIPGMLATAAAAYASLNGPDASPYRASDNGCNNHSSGPNYGAQCTW